MNAEDTKRLEEIEKRVAESSRFCIDESWLISKLREVDGEMEHFKESSALLKELHITENGIEAHVEANPEISKLIAHAFVSMVASSPNYTEMTFEPKTVEHKGQFDCITVTIQKVKGKTPHQKRMEAEAQVTDLKSLCATLEQRLRYYVPSEVSAQLKADRDALKLFKETMK